MEVAIRRLHPNDSEQNLNVYMEQPDFEKDVDSYNEVYEDAKVLVLKQKHLKQKKAFEEVQLNLDEKQLNVMGIILSNDDSRFNLDVNKMEVVKFSADLLQTLTLNVNYMTLTGRTVRNFDETLAYVSSEKDKFYNLVTKRKGYLQEDSNYYQIDKSILSEDREAIILANSRVILFWRGLTLNEWQIKRIITLGLLHLIGQLTVGQLYIQVKDIIPKGIFEVSIKSEDRKSVV